MKIEGIEYLLGNKGYQCMATNLSEVRIFLKKDDEEDGRSRIRMIITVSTAVKHPLSLPKLEEMARGLERKYLLTGTGSVEILFLVFSDNIERDKSFSEGDIRFWLVDTLTRRLIIFEDQPDDFDHIKSELELMIAGKISYEKENRGILQRDQNGNVFIPYLTILIMLINITVFVILERLGSTEDPGFMLKHGASYTERVFGEHEFYRLFTCMFLHFGISHLLSNMFALWFIGGEVERLFGRGKFLLIYFFTGLCASILSEVMNYLTSKAVVSAGASGAIYGIQGALMVLVFANRKEKGSRMYKMLVMLLMLLVLGRVTENVDNYAHLGGFITGLLCGWMLKKQVTIRSR